MQPDDPSSESPHSDPATVGSGGASAAAPAVSGPLGSHRVDPELGPYVALLSLVFTVFVVQGVVTPSDLVLVGLVALLGATTVLALDVAHVGRRFVRGAVVVTVALVIATAIEAAAGGIDRATLSLAEALLVAVAPPAILLGVIRRLKATRAVTVEAVVGVLSVYMLLGMTFAFAYGAIDRIGHGDFFAQGGTATVSTLQYFSFTTLATVGYGDYTAASNLGHTLSVFEAVLGQVYLVTVVSLIIGNLGRRQSR
jgi:hypothetical protein